MRISDGPAVYLNGLTEGGYKCLDPVCKKAMYLGAVPWTIFELVIVLLVGKWLIGGKFELIAYVLFVLFAVHIVYKAVMPVIYHRRFRYRITDDHIDTCSWVVFMEHTMVPIEGIREVNVTAGPILRRYGLADVKVTTAGGTVDIDYLRKDEAESIAKILNEVVVRILRDRGTSVPAPKDGNE